MNVKKYIKEMEEYTKKVSSSKKNAQEFLQKTGVYTKKGNLRKVYKNKKLILIKRILNKASIKSFV